MAVPSVAFLDGEIVAFEEARVPIEDRGLQFAESLYEVVAITGGEPRMLFAHAQRMRDAAAELGLDAGVPDDPTWARIAEQLCARDPVPEGLLYAQVTGGEAPRSHVPRTPPRPRFWAYVRDFRFPRDAEVARGIRGITMTDPRWSRCDLKTTMLLPAVMAKRAAAREGAGEAIFLAPEDGLVREGASSTVFVVEGRTLTSPALSAHLLPGTTGTRLARLAGDADLTVRAEDVHVARLRSAHELFVASTTLLVMPVTHLDGDPIGSGAPGPVARDLARRLREDLCLAE